MLLVLYVIPLVNIVPVVLVPLDIAKYFGKSSLFGVGLILFGFVFYPILGFGDARYLATTEINS